MKTTLAMPDQVAEHWHLVKDLLKKAIDHGVGESTLTDYLTRILNYQAQLWVFSDDADNIVGVGLTKFIDYSTHRTLHIVAVAGVDWPEWADQYYVVEKFAKENNCKAVEQWGRPGWSRVLPKVIPGFETVYHVMRKEIP
jgi:hypothetical protein